MALPFALTICGYRSLEKCKINFNRKFTFITGPNNSGKSNLLRILSHIFNNQFHTISPSDFPGGGGILEFSIKESHVIELFGEDKTISRYMSTNTTKDNINILVHFSSSGFGACKFSPAAPSWVLTYLNSIDAMGDFGDKINERNSLEFICEWIFSKIKSYLSGTVFVPSLRFITPDGNEPAPFIKESFAGGTLNFGSILPMLQTGDRPPHFVHKELVKKQHSALQDFVRDCVDAKDVKIQIPFDKGSIDVIIDGVERPLHNLGTGIEHIIMMAIASQQFQNFLVLAEEPEIHLHPRLQKKMINMFSRYFSNNFVITTHSGAILDSIDADILQFSITDGLSKVRTIETVSQRYEAVRALGHSYSELLLSRYVIWVEGPSDRIYLKAWIRQLDPDILEGIDFTFAFYGGKILSHHSFSDVPDDLVACLSLGREFAVVIDSDRSGPDEETRANKKRVQAECQDVSQLCWITDGREIENYVPTSVIEELAEEVDTETGTGSYSQIKPKNKVRFAQEASARMPIDIWSRELLQKMEQLVDRIKQAAR